MKTRHIIIAAAAVAALAACQKAEVVPVETQEEIVTQLDPWTLCDLSYLVNPGVPGQVKVSAGFDETKTQIEMNSAGTFATTVWSPGDSFLMLSHDTENDKYYASNYTTTVGGVEADFVAEYSLPGTEFWSFYPEFAGFGTYNGGLVFGVNLPTTQTAVAGNIDSGAALAFAVSSSADAFLHFKNATALVKFRLTGAAVSTLTSVTLKGSSNLAGDLIIIPNGDIPEFEMNLSFSGDVKSRSVELVGTFEEGMDYYIAVAPGVQSVVSMVFTDGTNTETKTSSKSITFNRSRITDFGTIDLGNTIETPVTLAPVQYSAATTGLKPVTIAVIPEGFTEAELTDYEMLAKSGLDALFSTEPYKSYKEYFNVWILKAPSNESGADITDGKGNIKTARDTYFSSGWGESSYGDMGADDDKVFAFVEDNCPDILDGTHSINEVPIIMIINDERYGGICWSWGSGKCYAMVPFTGGGSTLGWGYASVQAASDSDPSAGTKAVTSQEKAELGESIGDWRNTLVHEFGGHGFGRLADEYWSDEDKGAVSAISSHSWSVPFGLNISATYDNTPWKADLLDNKAALVSANPLYDRIGVYQGGQVSVLNRWRSEKISCMIDNRRYFSTWQRELIVKRIMSLAGGTFSLTEFFSKDSPIDPVRDVASSPVLGNNHNVPVRMMPPLAPPVLVDE